MVQNRRGVLSQSQSIHLFLKRTHAYIVLQIVLASVQLKVFQIYNEQTNVYLSMHEIGINSGFLLCEFVVAHTTSCKFYSKYKNAIEKTNHYIVLFDVI